VRRIRLNGTPSWARVDPDLARRFHWPITKANTAGCRYRQRQGGARSPSSILPAAPYSEALHVSWSAIRLPGSTTQAAKEAAERNIRANGGSRDPGRRLPSTPMDTGKGTASANSLPRISNVFFNMPWSGHRNLWPGRQHLGWRMSARRTRTNIQTAGTRAYRERRQTGFLNAAAARLMLRSTAAVLSRTPPFGALPSGLRAAVRLEARAAKY